MEHQLIYRTPVNSYFWLFQMATNPIMLRTYGTQFLIKDEMWNLVYSNRNVIFYKMNDRIGDTTIG